MSTIWKRVGIGMLLGCCLWIRVFPFFGDTIPLGYDPGLYRSMFLAYQQLGTTRDLASLPTWIQHMYEPLLGMRWALWGMIGWWWSDLVLTWWRAVCSCLPILGIWLLGRVYSRRVAIFAIFLAIFSFTQWSVFWRAYRKQGIGMFLVAVVLWWRSKRYTWSLAPVIVAACLVTRTAWVILLLVGVIAAGHLLLTKQDKRKTLAGSWLLSAIVLIPALVPLWGSLVQPMLAPFFSSLHFPWQVDGFQSWGTFLTIYEYFVVGGVVLVCSLWWWLISSQKHMRSMLVASSYVLLIMRVFFQAFFFQRMIAYLDMFVIVYAAVALDRSWQKTRWHRWLVGIIVIAHSLIGIYWMQRTYYPLIEKQEFAFLSQMSTLPSDALVIVPGIWYSPRVQGRTQRDVLAPWLFDTNRRGNLDQEREHRWYMVSGQEKCVNLLADYPEIKNRSVYLWVWSKQSPTSLDGECFHLVDQWQWRSRRSVSWEG